MNRSYLLAAMFGLLFAGPALAEGAIATGDGGKVGISYNLQGARAAENRAIQECGGGCRILTTFRKICAAVATGERGGWSWATRDRLQLAGEAALEGCRKEGKKQCRVAVQGCDEKG